MEIFYMIYIFIMGTVLGSFYNVVGYRLPKGESLVSPPSHCPKCNHRLTAIELIPIFSYLIQGGKCKNCKTKISPFYASFEFLTGLLFLIAYLTFGFSPMLLIALTFISVLVIVCVSDYNFMIIPDEVLIIGSVLILIEKFIFMGGTEVLNSLISGIVAFIAMFLIKLIGDFIFKKESLGGGDIKLMFIFGLVLPLPISILPIFLGSIIALPISLVILIIKKDHMLPFGPYLSLAALILFLLEITPDHLYEFLINLY